MQDRVRGSGAGRARIWVAVIKFSTQQTHIDAPVERVWDLVGDPNRHPDWWPEMVEVDCADLHEGCRYRGVVKGVVGADEHELLVERLELENLDGCREVAIFCEGTGVTTSFMLTEAQGGTFVEGRFSVDPASLGMRVLSAVAGRRFLRSWLDRSLHNLKTAAERTASPAA
jgi:Polyketide cyclase / dehydrase and lipid transport